jgi:UDP-N-acetylmuramate dehydrogenase
MKSKTDFSLKALNTFGVEATAARYFGFDAEDEILHFLKKDPIAGQQYLVLGGGSNLLLTDDFDGIVLHPQLKGIETVAEDQDHIWLRAMAGENWDDLAAHAVARGWGGLENLSLIPGSVGASVVQNIGAYGVEVKEVIDRVEAIDLGTAEKVVFSPDDCGFDYRYSHFKGSRAGRYIITAVVFRLCRNPRFVLDYPGVEERVARLGPMSLKNVRQAIIDIRREKLPDPAEIGNAGSFFKNPVVDQATLEQLRQRFADLPHYPQADGRFKLAAGWMIDRCGWKGRQMGRAGVHDMQALVLLNLGGAAGREILDLSEQVRLSVRSTFGIDLEREVLVVP